MANIPGYITTYYLYPGNLFASHKPFVVTTILGSCVSVCLWDPVIRIGGINHYLLPLWNGEGLPTPKYGNVAITKLIKKMISLGSGGKNLRAKVFGGASINQGSKGLLNVGQRNIIVVKDTLADEGIPIVSSDTGGNLGRKLLFFTETGIVRVKVIKQSKG